MRLSLVMLLLVAACGSQAPGAPDASDASGECGPRPGICVDSCDEGIPESQECECRDGRWLLTGVCETWDNTCNPVAQTGCQLGEKCAFIVDQLAGPQIGHLGCTPDGDDALGAACTEPAAPGTSDTCAAGFDCHNGYCHQICTALNDQCVDGMCESFVDELGNALPLEVCLPNCDPLTQNCPSDIEGCYVADEAICVLAGTKTVGQTCEHVNDCEPGLTCLADICRRLCGPVFDCWLADGAGDLITPTACECGDIVACGPGEICWPLSDTTGAYVSDVAGGCVPDMAVPECNCSRDPICGF